MMASSMSPLPPTITRVSARTSSLLLPADDKLCSEATSSNKTFTVWGNAKRVPVSEPFHMYEKEGTLQAGHTFDGSGKKEQQLVNDVSILECDAPSIVERITLCSSPAGYPLAQNGFRLFATFSGVMYNLASQQQSVNSERSSTLNNKKKSFVAAADKERRKDPSKSFNNPPVPPAHTFSFPAILLASSSSKGQTTTMAESNQVLSHDLKSHKKYDDVCVAPCACALPSPQLSPQNAQRHGDRTTANVLPNKGISCFPSAASSCASCGISCTSGTLADFVFALTSASRGNTTCEGREAEGRDSALSLLVEESEDDRDPSCKTHSSFSHPHSEKDAFSCGNFDNPNTRRNDLKKEKRSSFSSISSSLIVASVNEACDREALIATATRGENSQVRTKNNNDEVAEGQNKREQEEMEDNKTQSESMKTLGDFLLPLLPPNILRRISEWQFTVDLLLVLNPKPPSAGPQQLRQPSCKEKPCHPTSWCSCPVSTRKDNGAGSGSKRGLLTKEERRMRRHYRRDLKKLQSGGLKHPSKRYSSDVNCDYRRGGVVGDHLGVGGGVNTSSFNIWALSTPSDPPFLSGASTVTCDSQPLWGGHVRTPTPRSTCRTHLRGSANVSGKSSRVEIKRNGNGNRLANKAGKRVTPCGLRAFPCPATPSPSPSSPTYPIPSQRPSSSPYSFSTTLTKSPPHTYMYGSSSTSSHSETSSESDHEGRNGWEHTVDSALLTPISQVRRAVRKCGTARFTVDEDGAELWPPSIDIDTLGLPLDYVD